MNNGSFWFQFVILSLSALPAAFFYWRVLGIRRGYWRTLWILALWFVPAQAFVAFEPLWAARCSEGFVTFVHAAYLAADLVITVVLLRSISRAKWIRCLLAYLLMVAVCAAGAALVRIPRVALALSGSYAVLADALASTAMISAVQWLLLFIAAQIAGRFFTAHPVDVKWNAFAIVLAAQIAGMTIVSFLSLSRPPFEVKSFIPLTVYSALAAVADIFLARAFRETVRSAELTQKLLLFRQQRDMLKEQYQDMDGQLTAIRRIRHDYANTLETIDRLLVDGHADKAAALAVSTRETLERSVGRYTGQPVVDAVLYNKLQQAGRQDIRMELNMLLPAELPVSDADLIGIFTNLIDNAIEYCAVLPAGTERKILLEAGIQSDILALRVSNTFLGEVSPLDEPRTTKPDAAQHGLGIAFVKSIAEDYHGALSSKVADGMLHVTLMLNLPETPDAA